MSVHFSITLDGQRYDLNPGQQLMPLGYADLQKALDSGLEFKVDGLPEESKSKTVKLTFKEMPFFLLVDGGVLPPHPSISTKYHVFLDKNVSDTRETRDLAAALLGDCEVNPMMGCCESQHPTFEAFKKEHDDFAAKRIQESFSKCVSFDDEQLKVCYEILLSLGPDEELEAKLISQVAEYVANPISKDRIPEVANQIVSVAAETGVPRNNVVFVTLLQIIFGGKTEFTQCGRKALKPTANMTIQQVKNGLADIRQLKFLALTKCIGIKGCLLSNDRNLALLWAGLHMSGVEGADPPGFTLAPDRKIFPLGNYNKIGQLFSSMIDKYPMS